MMDHDRFRRLLAPQSIAIIGSLAHPSKFGAKTRQHLEQAGYAGALYPVAAVSELSEPVDVAVVAVPAAAVPAVIAALSTPIDHGDAVGPRDAGALRSMAPDDSPRGPAATAPLGGHQPTDGMAANVVAGSMAANVVAGSMAANVVAGSMAANAVAGSMAANVIVYASGFSEANGSAVAVPAGGPSLLGPNTVGVYWAPARAVISFAQAFDSLTECAHGSGIAIISQSGAFGARMVTAARRRGLIIDGFIATGNEDGYSVASCIEGLLHLEEDRPRVIGLYLESVPDPAALHRSLDAARAAEVSVVVLRGGRSDAGAHAAASHTAAVSPPGQILDAMLRLDGVIRVESDREFIDAMAAVSGHHRTSSRRVVILTGSGGAGVVAADGISARGCALPRPSAPLAADLAAALPPFAAIGNPIDVTAQVIGDTERLSDLIAMLGRSGEFDSALVIGRADQVRSVDRRGRRHGMAVVTAVLDGGDAMTAEALGSGVVAFGELSAAVHAVAALSTPPGLPARASEEPTAAPRWDIGAIDDTAMSLRRLDDEGIALAPWAAVHRTEQCRTLGEQLGFPLVAKANLAAHEHKAAVGGIHLDIGSVEELEHTVWAMAQRMGRSPDGRRSTTPIAVVARQLRGGPELFVGVRRDHQFGYVMAAGLGGSAMELINRSIAVASWSPPEWIEAELMQRVFGQDSRWGPSARALVDLGARLLAIAQRERAVLIECNPVVMIDGDLIALDARVLTDTPAIPPAPHPQSTRGVVERGVVERGVVERGDRALGDSEP